MKKIALFLLGFIVINSLYAQLTFTINKGVGDTFDPATLTVNQGDIVHFNLSAPHQVLQVSLDTWNANGTTALAGGFSFPTGSGDFTASTPGIIYYVCTVHVDLGMKGKITVNAITGINDITRNSRIKIYPNPANNFITYEMESISPVHTIKIINISGSEVKIIEKPEFSGKQIRIDIGNLNKGMYFIQVKSDDGIVSRKFMKS